MRASRFIPAALVLQSVIVLFADSASAGRSGRDAIRGVVVDSTGRGFTNAAVTLVELERSVRTDSLGRFGFRNVPNGWYTIWAETPECRSPDRLAQVLAGSTSRIRFVMECPECSFGPGYGRASAPSLPLRPRDFRRFPRRGFGFAYEISTGERVDTFEGLVTKDLVTLPDTTIKLTLSAAELDTIYRKMIEIRFFEISLPRMHRCPQVIQPNADIHFRVMAGPVSKTLQWNSGEPPITDDRVRLIDLLQLIRRIVWAHPEYRALPPARGLYY